MDGTSICRMDFHGDIDGDIIGRQWDSSRLSRIVDLRLFFMIPSMAMPNYVLLQRMDLWLPSGKGLHSCGV